ENEMMKEYNVSRDTIRKALNLLESNGYIQKVKGKGSFVLDINKFDFPVSGLTSFKELSTSIANAKDNMYCGFIDSIPGRPPTPIELAITFEPTDITAAIEEPIIAAKKGIYILNLYQISLAPLLLDNRRLLLE
ncbi:trehalose operon repressor, partial [Clostridium botulinum Af84]